MGIACFGIRRLSNILGTDACKTAYYSYFHSLIKYGIIFWGNSSNMRGDPKITNFLKWFIRFYTITTLVSFKVSSFWLNTLVPTFFPLLKTFLELFSAGVVQDLRFLFHFADIIKTFSLHLAFRMREQEKVAWRRVGWIGRMRDNRHVVFWSKTVAHSRPCGQGHCRGEGTSHRCSTFLVFFWYTIA